MPSKKANKAAKKPGKAIPKKAAVRKTAIVPKKAARASPGLKHISKVTVKPHKPTMKSSPAKHDTKHDTPSSTSPARPKPQGTAPAKPASVVTNGPAPSAEKTPPTVKFDSRPLLIPTRTPPSDDDGDVEQSGSASLLAGPRNVKPYIARRGEQYMSKEQLEHFARILQNWKRDLMVEVDRTVLHMKDEAANFPDPNDRATQEEEFSLELRTRDRERKLIRKIDEALKRIEDGSYGYCLETGEEIGIKRLEARPVATLSVEAQERRERREKQYGDRDDRYR
jgi:RNA polymerase-binding transcription factor